MKTQGMTLLPPASDKCQSCAKSHEEELPHDQQSLFYQYWFYFQFERWPTWVDAMAHCSDEIKSEWVKLLKEHGVIV